MPRTLSYFLILIGGIIAIYAQAGAEQNQFVLIIGIAVLMLGIYSVSRNIPSKRDKDDQENTPS